MPHWPTHHGRHLNPTIWDELFRATNLFRGDCVVRRGLSDGFDIPPVSIARDVESVKWKREERADPFSRAYLVLTRSSWRDKKDGDFPLQPHTRRPLFILANKMWSKRCVSGTIAPSSRVDMQLEHFLGIGNVAPSLPRGISDNLCCTTSCVHCAVYQPCLTKIARYIPVECLVQSDLGRNWVRLG